MLPKSEVVIVGESPGAWTGDRIVRYSDGVVEHVECGRYPSRVPQPPSIWATMIPQVVLEVPPPLAKNRAMKRRAKFGKKPRRRRF
jgi:hypothetical protein